MRLVALVLALLFAAPAMAQGKRRGNKPAPTAPRRPEPVRPALAPAPPPAAVMETPPAVRPVAVPGANLPLAVMLGMGAHRDDGTMRGSERVSISVTRENFDFGNESLAFGSVAVLIPFADRVRVGLGAHYFGKYDYKRSGERMAVNLGRLFEAVALAEHAIPLRARTHFLLGAEAGLAVLFPGGALEAEIDRLRAAGANVWKVPRFGYTLGPSVAARYQLWDRLAVRLDLAALWAQTFLFFTSDEVDRVGFEKRRRANVVRYRLGLSIEVPL